MPVLLKQVVAEIPPPAFAQTAQQNLPAGSQTPATPNNWDWPAQIAQAVQQPVTLPPPMPPLQPQMPFILEAISGFRP